MISTEGGLQNDRLSAFNVVVFFSKIRQSVDSGVWTECKVFSKVLMFVFIYLFIFSHGSTALNGLRRSHC